MSTPDTADKEKWRKARKRVRQRQRRQGIKRVDYQPSEQVLALITVELRPYVGGDLSSVIDRLILKAAGVAPELMHTSRKRARANELGEMTDSAGIWRPVHTCANDFGMSPPWKSDYLARCKARDAAKRVVCGGRRRRDGQPCEALSLPGKRRCKWHGGCSTGPRTVEGKARVTANLRSRSRKVEV